MTTLTKSQIKTVTPILEETKALLTSLRIEGVEFTVEGLIKEYVKEDMLLPDHTAVKLLINHKGVTCRVMFLQVTARGKLLSSEDNSKTYFSKLNDLKNFIAG